MAFCSNCGKELNVGSKFCDECGTAVLNTEPKRKTVFEGDIHKCPHCGETIKSFCIVCPACGYEFRGMRDNSAIKELQEKLSCTTSDQEKILIIQTFNVPNTKENIIEFMLLAASNFDADMHASHLDELDISDAWLAKVEQCYQKAKRSFNNQDLRELTQVYDNIQNQCKEKEHEYKSKKIEKTLEEKREKNAEKFKQSKLKNVLIILIIVSVGFALIAFLNGRFISGIVSILIFVGALISILMGLNVLKEKILYLHILTTILSFFLIVPYFTLFSNDWQISDLNPNVLAIGIKSEELASKSRTGIENILRSKGFINISTEEVPWQKNKTPGEVNAITIDGKSNFKERDRFHKEDIVIIYCVGAPINLPTGAKASDFIGLDYQDVADVFKNKGFENIQFSELPWIEGVEPEKVFEVSIDGNNSFVETDEYSQNANILIKYYQKPIRISVGYNSRSLSGKNFQDVTNIFKSLDFNNIELVEVNWEKGETKGRVKNVTINGSDKFSAYDEFLKNASVIIYYYDGPKQVVIDFSFKDIKGKNYKDVVEKFSSLGFVYIEVFEGSWNLLHKSGSVKSVVINGDDGWTEGDCFLQDAKVAIEYYK